MNNRKDIEIKIGEKLKKARIACGFTQEQVCEKIDCASRYIGQLENNETMGSIPLILRLCDLYCITPNYLYSDYLKTDFDFKNNDVIDGYYKLNNTNRCIIDNNISFMNKLQNSNSKK